MAASPSSPHRTVLEPTSPPLPSPARSYLPSTLLISDNLPLSTRYTIYTEFSHGEYYTRTSAYGRQHAVTRIGYHISDPGYSAVHLALYMPLEIAFIVYVYAEPGMQNTEYEIKTFFFPFLLASPLLRLECARDGTIFYTMLKSRQYHARPSPPTRTPNRAFADIDPQLRWRVHCL
jgi:hypothetical protein